ncbi:unnamed protein product [Owenia fusiformis]|uniref:Uncharacterized protein n=1 Tax=Owenia fusiformis TaxID=6347 RepID=A0A8J1XZG5_OWEFU|nr:unnamed protein product [Owenia fusiformis]
MEETKIIYHIDDEDTPYLIKLSQPPDKVTLGDLKNALNRPNYKFFFKSMDDDFGVVKEEIVDEEAHLPCFNGRVVSWLVAADNSASDNGSQCADSNHGDAPLTQPPPPTERLGGIGDSRPPSFHANVGGDQDSCDTCTETDSLISSRRGGQIGSHGNIHYNPPQPQGFMHPQDPRFYDPRMHPALRGQPSHPQYHPNVPRINGHSKHRDPRERNYGFDGSSSMMSSDLESTSFFDSEDDSRFSTITDTTTRSSKYGRHRQRRRRRHKLPPISRASSFSSITDSTMSLNIITVTLNMETVNFLGISIVGQSNKGGDGGIYVGSIMKGGAVAQDGRIEPGDMILEVNGISFENMSNDDAVKTLREAVQRPGYGNAPQPVTLVVAKCWDPNPKGYFTIPRQEPVRPIDPSAWVAHTTAMQREIMGKPPHGPGSVATMTSTSSSLTSSIPESERYDDFNLSVNSDMASVVKCMAQPDSGLEIRDRMWLKITIPNAFIGSDLVEWLHTHVEGFADRRDSRRYACNLLKAGYIKHTVNKITFSEQCYYIFGDMCGSTYPVDMSQLSLEDVDSVSEADRDTLAPLPPPAWNPQYSYGPNFTTAKPPAPPQVPISYAPPPPNFTNDMTSCTSMSQTCTEHGNESVHSGSALTHATSHNNAACACNVVNHTYKHLRKLWVNKDKENALNQEQKEKLAKKAAKESGFLADSKSDLPDEFDIDRSTSSSTGSSTSGSSRSKKNNLDRKSASGSGSDTDTASLASMRRVTPINPNPSVLPTKPDPAAKPIPPPRDLAQVSPDVSGSRQSFRMAMGNPLFGE